VMRGPQRDAMSGSSAMTRVVADGLQFGTIRAELLIHARILRGVPSVWAEPRSQSGSGVGTNSFESLGDTRLRAPGAASAMLDESRSRPKQFPMKCRGRGTQRVAQFVEVAHRDRARGWHRLRDGLEIRCMRLRPLPTFAMAVAAPSVLRSRGRRLELDCTTGKQQAW
jgi:hypothetical protein